MSNEQERNVQPQPQPANESVQNGQDSRQRSNEIRTNSVERSWITERGGSNPEPSQGPTEPPHSN